MSHREAAAFDDDMLSRIDHSGIKCDMSINAQSYNDSPFLRTDREWCPAEKNSEVERILSLRGYDRRNQSAELALSAEVDSEQRFDGAPISC